MRLICLAAGREKPNDRPCLPRKVMAVLSGGVIQQEPPLHGLQRTQSPPVCGALYMHSLLLILNNPVNGGRERKREGLHAQENSQLFYDLNSMLPLLKLGSDVLSRGHTVTWTAPGREAWSLVWKLPRPFVLVTRLPMGEREYLLVCVHL